MITTQGRFSPSYFTTRNYVRTVPLSNFLVRGRFYLNPFAQNRLRRTVPILCLLVLFAEEGLATEKIRVVATSSTLASIVREIAQDKADIHHVASPRRDIHFIEPTPVDVLKVKKADAFVHNGLDLEVWRNPLLDAAGNAKFLGEGKASIDTSRGIPLLEIPTSLSRAEGDLHQFGNPHFWVDPLNAKLMAKNIAKGLSELYPEDKDFFMKNADAFDKKIDEKMKEWSGRVRPFQGAHVVTYHRSWPYFLGRFGFVTIGELEPKPGIPPTAQHLAELMKEMKEKKVKVVIKESFHEGRAPEKVAKETGAHVVTLDQEVGENKGVSDYTALIDHNLALLEKALTS